MTCIVVYGREPIAGRVKTRLAASIGGEAAAELYRLLLARAVQQAVQTGFQVVLALSEQPGAGWNTPPGVALEIQRGGDLGARLADTFDRRFSENWSRVIVVGSDCPGMTAEHIRSAETELERCAVVLGPAEDGGYWLVGQRPPGADLFSGVSWSTSGVMEATRSRLREAGIEWAEIERLADVDTLKDLERSLGSQTIDAELLSQLNGVIVGAGGYHGRGG
jgi:rSAM/selenodomain-associated transferase 1